MEINSKGGMMSDQRPAMLMPALIGGAAAGLLSGIPLLNCLCCLWIIGGAILASYLLAKDSPVALTSGDGAIVGVFTGIVAAVVDAVISIPLHSLNKEFVRKIMEAVSEYAEEMPPGWESWFETGAYGASLSMFMLGLVISAVIFAALGALGGIIGISLFKKKTPPKLQGASDVSQDTGNR